MSNVSEAAVIREVDAEELQARYNEMMNEYHLIGNLQWLYDECFGKQLQLIKTQYFQLTHKNINND